MQFFFCHQKKRKVKLDKVREGLGPKTLRFRANARKLILGSIGTPLVHLRVYFVFIRVYVFIKMKNHDQRHTSKKQKNKKKKKTETNKQTNKHEYLIHYVNVISRENKRLKK